MHDKRAMENDNQKPRATPTVSAAWDDGMLVELLYDPRARTTAFAVWRGEAWSIEEGVTRESGERLVPFSPDNNLVKHEAVMLPSTPLEYGSPAELLAEITAFIHRYLDVSPLFEKVASYYVLLTWIYDAFNELPYLRLRGDYGTGKTRALLTLGSLCYKAFFASGASTVSPLFHTLDNFRGTLVIDEADFRMSDEKAEIVKILNTGNVRGMPVLRTMMTNQREFNPRAFHVFGPKIVAARKSFDDRALESRFITENMGERRLRADIPINLPDTHREEALTLRNKLLLYRFRTRSKAAIDPTLVDRAIEPRLNQILVPLLSVIENEALRRDLKAVAASYQEAMISDRGLTPEADVLEVLRELVSEGSDSLPIRNIVARFIERFGSEYERPITHRWMGNMLRRRLNLATYKSHGVYVLPLSERPKLDVLFTRFGIDVPAVESSHEDTAGRHGDVGTSGEDRRDAGASANKQ